MMPLHPYPGAPALAAAAPAPAPAHNATASADAVSTLRTDTRHDSRRLRRVKDSKEQLKSRNKSRSRALSTATIDTAATASTSAGRSYTVANLHNGLLYLRPVVRPGNQRHTQPQDTFVFPPPQHTPHTPPDSANLCAGADWQQHSAHASTSPTTRRSPTPPLPAGLTPLNQNPPAPFVSLTQHATSRPNAHHARAHSFSTADDLTVTSASNEPGTFKVVIERPPFGRPRTADTSSLSFPLLEVPIPTYHLGTPRFSTRGTLDMRSSIYTRTSATDDFRNSLLTPNRPGTHSFLSSRLSSDAFSPVPARYRATMDRPPLPPSAPSSSRMSHAPISPRLYDALTINPDDSTVVRFSAAGDILAATPSRLVAHITSPSFLDYELLSDFFLTFRAFLSTRDLVAYLISRLQWAVDRQDDFGRIVRVRTFVALRHWILNYFVDDFAPVYALRVYFCTLVNSLYASLKARTGGSAGDVKIVGELKKCWRRTCALYWENEDNTGRDFGDEPLLPGGYPDSQTSFEAAFPVAPVPVLAPVSVPAPVSAPAPSTPPRQTARDTKDTMGSNPSDQFASRHMDWAQKTRHTPQNSMSAPNGVSYESDTIRVPLSPASEQSMHVLSCSIPRRGLNKAEKSTNIPLNPHPVPHPAPAAPPRLAASPQLSTAAKKPNRPSETHKRSGSFSDALRDSRAPLSIPKNASVDMTISAITSMPGSLVRGGLFQPSSPYIEVQNNSLRHTRSRSETDGEDLYTGDLHMRNGHAASPGMKKIFGTMRRALSIKQQPGASPQLGGPAHRRLASSIRSSNPITTSTASGGIHKRRLVRTRPEVRVDMLASRVVESFRQAVEEQMRNEDQQHDDTEAPDLYGFEFEFGSRKNSAVDADVKVPDARVQSEITTGSKSILIIDDTGPPPLPEFSGALPMTEAAEPVARDPSPEPDQRDVSIDMPVAADPVPEPRALLERRSQPSLQRPLVTKRSISGAPERMHSFRRRGSARISIARSSLRRHASHNSLLSRHPKPESIATFQTMSSDNDPFFLDRHPVTDEPTPARQLRRRPGGDLRAADNIHDLEPIPRPHSTGSISTRTHSIANSIILRSDHFVPEPSPSHQTEAIDEPVIPKKPISLVATHSSQPNLRPSFEAEVAKLAALPDDLDDEGGIEATLLKLEGRYEKKSPSVPSARASMQPEVYLPTGAPVEPSKISYIPLNPDERTETKLSCYRPPTPPEVESKKIYQMQGEEFGRREPAVDSAGESEDSYSSIPLLDRHLSDAANLYQTPTLDTMRSSAKPSPLQHADGAIARAAAESGSPGSSLEYVVETASMKRIPNGETFPRSPIARHSFLLGEDEDFSDMASTTTGARSEGTSHGVRSFFDDEPATIENEMGKHPMHPMRHPPTPPQTATRLNDTLTEAMLFDRGLPSPVLTPTVSRANQTFSQQPGDKQSGDIQAVPKSSGDKPSEPTVHMPFILAYDAEVLAQQFTVVEKDALDEIDWKELIELRWKQSSPQIRDWVHYLQTQEARGVDVVIARFNLVVKWAVSECLLTESIEERARCIVQYIHIATHARRLRNYATMYQIAIALISNDISRLHKTWALVPLAERQVMRELEALVQPLKNFHNLRLEMETATVEDGCIPFIGIYTRDLIYNAQKPAFIDAPPVDGERLVNFERHHTAATIVKNLLRLLEASSRYAFKVEPDLISKCLWLAALGDDEISARGRQCE